jgi:hypothetical protein
VSASRFSGGRQGVEDRLVEMLATPVRLMPGAPGSADLTVTRTDRAREVSDDGLA